MTIAIACARELLNLFCDGSKYLTIKAANYGRTNANTCFSNRIHSSNCIQKQSLSIVKRQCERKHNCTIAANNAVFRNPCRKTYKYLNVTYDCVGLFRSSNAFTRTTLSTSNSKTNNPSSTAFVGLNIASLATSSPTHSGHASMSPLATVAAAAAVGGFVSLTLVALFLAWTYRKKSERKPFVESTTRTRDIQNDHVQDLAATINSPTLYQYDGGYEEPSPSVAENQLIQLEIAEAQNESANTSSAYCVYTDQAFNVCHKYYIPPEEEHNYHEIGE